MAEPFIGEIRMFAGNFAPYGWAFCDGSVMSIAENDALFALIGTTYGGDGQNTFALPDLRGRIPIHQGQGPGLSNRTIGEIGGSETATLIASQMPAHNHALMAVENGTVTTPQGNLIGGTTALQQFDTSSVNAFMNSGAISITGGSQPHENRMPVVTINFIIALFGIFPSQS